MSSFEPFFIIFWDIISSLILTAAIFIGKLGRLNGEIALIYM